MPCSPGWATRSEAGQYLPADLPGRDQPDGASAGTAFQGISKRLQTPAMQADIKTFGTNASQAFSVLLRAATPLVKAFTDIATVGSSFLPNYPPL